MRTRTPTVDEKKWLDRICEHGCIVCDNEGHGYSPAGPHHLDGATKKGCHYKSIPLCGAHHQIGGYGVAFHAGRVVWEAKYGTEQQLLNQMLLLFTEKECGT